MRPSTGQINLEFLAAALIYLGALGGIVLVGQGALPDFTAETQEASLNLEARQISSRLLNAPGRQDYTGRTNWEKNGTTVRHATSVGLASGFKQVERDKLLRLRTINPVRGSKNYLNYSQFKRITGADHQYRFNFTWMPVIETSESFRRGNGDTVTPEIQEPDINDADGDPTYYGRSGNDIHYGFHMLNGTPYRFLVTSHNGIYNTTYVSADWDFQGHTPLGTGDEFGRGSDRFTVQRFQNREEEPGSLLMASQNLKSFGAALSNESRIITLHRYAVMEGEPLRVKVLAW